MSATTRVYKILSRAEWSAAQVAGVFKGAEIDLKDGYIHLSTAAQAAETARLHFRGREGLVVLELAVNDLALTWEPSRGGQLFPHLYGDLDPALVLTVHPLPLDADGSPITPPLTA